MHPGRRQKIETLLNAALERDQGQRGAFLAEACRGDEALRLEVESLLSQDQLETGPLFPPVRLEAIGLSANDLTGRVFPPGTLLGPYRIEEPIGAGGMGLVFRGVDTRLGRAVAIKVSHRRFDARFEREARAIASLNHPHICTLHDIGPDYLVMELVDGETLGARLQRGKLTIPEVLRYGSQVASALAEAHSRGVTHRDLKPGNVMLAKNGAKVVDFGIAKLQTSSDEPLTQTDAVMGTPAYMSPEQAEGKPVDTRSDVFSFGILLYEMVTGNLPFRGREEPGPVTELVPDTPPELARLIAQCLRKDPDRRALIMDDLRIALEELREESYLRLHRSRQSNQRYVLPALLVLASMLVGFWLYSRHVSSTPQASPASTQEAGSRTGSAYSVPTPTGYVTDVDGHLDLESKQLLERYAQGLADRHGSQLGAVVVDSLKGESIEQFSGAVFNSWRIGRKNKNDGLLLVLAIREHQSRLEVGRGLEYLFTTEVGDQILADMRPKLQKQQYGEALRDAFLTIGSILNGGTSH